MKAGSCLCGTVKFNVTTCESEMTHCHCSICRRLHGALFATFYEGKDLQITSGEAAITHYESSPGFGRTFCSVCGSPLPERPPSGDGVYVPAGIMDDDPGLRPAAHIFTESKAAWYEITDSLPQREHYGDDDLSRVVEVPEPVKKADVVTGNCQCGAVAFEYSGEPKMVMNCHCSRCRKVKGAAHATNVFVSTEQLTWNQGEDNVEVYAHEGAKVFGNAFCKTCGSSVPRMRPDGSLYNIPVGSLNQEPGADPKGHIFTDSKAPWFDITDDKPQWPEMPT